MFTKGQKDMDERQAFEEKGERRLRLREHRKGSRKAKEKRQNMFLSWAPFFFQTNVFEEKILNEPLFFFQ